jgi:hypothetical protein
MVITLFEYDPTTQSLVYPDPKTGGVRRFPLADLQRVLSAETMKPFWQNIEGIPVALPRTLVLSRLGSMGIK